VGFLLPVPSELEELEHGGEGFSGQVSQGHVVVTFGRGKGWMGSRGLACLVQ
jgi:hypothetical protein